jgi:hypothetical protein
VLSLARRWQAFSPAFLIVMAAVAVLVTVLDYVLGALAGMGLKLAYSGTAIFFYLRALFRHLPPPS